MGLHTLIEDTLYSLLHWIWPKQQLRSNQSSIADTCPAGSQSIMCWEATTNTLLLCVQALQAGVPAVLAAPSLLATAASAPGPGLPLILLQQRDSGRRKLKKPQTSCKDDPQVTTTPLHHPPLAPSFLPPSPPPPPACQLAAPYVYSCCLLGAIVHKSPFETFSILHVVDHTRETSNSSTFFCFARG